MTANRANAKKCTGPKSKASRLKTRFNALKLGLYASHEILPGEDRELYDAIQVRILAFYDPQAPMEEVLCGQIVKTIWRLRRLKSADTVAHKRASVSIVANEVRNEVERRDATEFEIDFTLIRSLYDEYAPPTTDESTPQLKESEIKLSRTGPVALVQKLPPPAFAFFKSYASTDGKPPGREIASEIRAVTKHLLQLHEKLEAMQARRMSIIGHPSIDSKVEDVARSPEHSSASNDQSTPEASLAVATNKLVRGRRTDEIQAMLNCALPFFPLGKMPNCVLVRCQIALAVFLA
jgi:hypothetical protein